MTEPTTAALKVEADRRWCELGIARRERSVALDRERKADDAYRDAHRRWLTRLAADRAAEIRGTERAG